jgi:hypothetical protein
MEASRDSNLEELTLLVDLLTREYAAVNDERRRTKIATEISALTARISVVRSRPLKEFVGGVNR